MNEMTYMRLRKKYLTNPERRPLVFEELWEVLKAEEIWVFKRGINSGLSILEIKGDFCMAIDDLIIRTTKDTPFEDIEGQFKQYFWVRVRNDIEENKGLRAPLMRGVKWRSKSKDGKDIPKEDLKYMRMLFDMDAVRRFRPVVVNTKPTEQLREQELNFTKLEIEKFVTKNFSQEDWVDFVYHNIYGEPLRDIAAYTKRDFTTIKRKTDKVLKAVGDYYDDKGRGMYKRLPQKQNKRK